MIEQVNLDLITAWDELNRLNNIIELYETKIIARKGISAVRLKEILIQCSTSGNDKFINTIIANDKDSEILRTKYEAKNALEIYIQKEIDRMKLSQPVICVAFLKEYKRKKVEDIAREMHISKRNVYRYYEEYLSKKKGITPIDNSYFEEKIIKK